MLICMFNTLSKHFKIIFQLYLTKTLDMTIIYNTGSLITRVPSVVPNNSVIMALQCNYPVHCINHFLGYKEKNALIYAYIDC